jgi:hypothetical protein
MANDHKQNEMKKNRTVMNDLLVSQKESFIRGLESKIRASYPHPLCWSEQPKDSIAECGVLAFLSIHIVMKNALPIGHM